MHGSAHSLASALDNDGTPHVVEVDSARSLGAENVAAKEILHDQGGETAMILRTIGWRPCTGRTRCVCRPYASDYTVQLKGCREESRYRGHRSYRA